MASKLKALLKNGTIVTSDQYPAIDHMPVDEIVQLVVESEPPGIPPVTVMVNLDAGERVWAFTRVIKSMSGDLTDLGGFRVPVFEIRNSGKMVSRLYWHPVAGPILTTQDLYEF